MRNRTVLLALSLTAAASWAATNQNSVIAAASTSSSANAATVSCLLDPGCSRAWSPGSADSGANEGVYVQFEEPVPAESVELTTNVKNVSPQFTLSINGAVSKLASNKPASGRYVSRYLVPGNHVKSIFFRLGVLKGGWQGFQLYSIRFYSQSKPLELALPVLVQASVMATSILEPQVAYQPANLFDSRYDFAWSVNGQASKGKGESVEIKFNQPQNLAGMMVWNGYQRSEIHFKANGRVVKVGVSDGTYSATLALADKMGSQRVQFASPFKNVSSFKLTIEEIAPGAKYPDVLISELRFIDDQNRILIPQVQGLIPASSPLIEALLDKSLSSVACSSSLTPGNFQRSLRLRKDGSFVIYGKAHDEEENRKTDQVLEGNWELRDSAIRIFGKRYSDTIVRNEYSQKTSRTPPSIFQSDLKVGKYDDLSSTEQQELAALIWSRIGSKADWEEADGARVDIQGVNHTVLARGTNEKALLEDLVKSLRSINPWTIRSPIVADAFLFSDDVGPCATNF